MSNETSKKDKASKTCPVCSWPRHPTIPGSARYGSPDADDEESVSSSEYLHALADVIQAGSAGVDRVYLTLCERHRRETDEIVVRDRTGAHPKRDPDLIAAEKRLRDAHQEVKAAEENFESAVKAAPPRRWT